MKLNNRGWGMREMIIYMCILILFLLFASYSVNSLYERLDSDKSDGSKPSENIQPVDLQYYRDLEFKLNNATFNYLVSSYNSANDIVDNVIDVELLKQYELIDNLYDQFGNNECKGYSKFYQNENGVFVVNSYVSCDNYETEGY